jgi:general stress protein YciG
MTGKPKGFAAMDPEKARKIQQKGGQTTKGNFKHDRERAREMGRKGMKARWNKENNHG